jgi:hypothetical protein
LVVVFPDPPGLAAAAGPEDGVRRGKAGPKASGAALEKVEKILTAHWRMTIPRVSALATDDERETAGALGRSGGKRIMLSRVWWACKARPLSDGLA